MRNLNLDEFTKYKFLSGLELSPQGKYAGFAVHNCNLDDNKYDSNLWLYSLENQKCFQLTGLNKESSFIWERDGEHILFSTIRDEKDKKRKEGGEPLTQYYRININGGEAQKAFQIPLNVTSIKQIDSENYLVSAVFDASHKDLAGLSEDEKAKELKRRKEEEAYEILEEIPFWANGAGFTDKKRSRLYIFNSQTGKYKPVSNESSSVESHNLNKDKTKLVYTVETFEDGVLALANDIYIYDIEKETHELLSEKQYSCGYVNFIDDNQVIFMGTDGKRYGLNENRKIYSIDISSKEIKCLTPELDKGIYNSVGSDCRYGGSSSYKVEYNFFYYTTTEGDSSFINRMDLTNGSTQKLTKPIGSIDGFSVIDHTILFIGLRELNLQELYQLKGEEEIKITTFNEWVTNEIKLSKPEVVSFSPIDGVTVDGWVMKPVDFDESKSYPAILNIHGGPKTVYGTVFYHEMQYWVNRGYFVFFCNPRGSDGKGNEFADIRGKYGTIDYDDIMQFTDEVLEKYPNIDKNRLGVTGGSYGGFMTNWIIGHTHRFKAAASQRSISNWIAKFGITDIGYFFVEDQQGATPWSNPDKLWWHSPMRYVDKVKTPTLIIHSDADYRCWINEGYQMFTSLKYHGVEARMCVFKGENHELTRSGKPKNRIKNLEEITNWFDKYLT